MRVFHRQQNQPQAPTEVEQFLELERGRLASALQRETTGSDNSLLIDSALDMLVAAAEGPSEDPSTELYHAGGITTVIAEAAFVVDSLQATLDQLPTYLSLPPHERAEDIYFIGTASGIGSVVLHGLNVSAWNERNPHIPLLPDNAVAKIVSDTVLEKYDTKKEIKEIMRFLQHPY